jgi:hypothetical protein
MSWVQNAATHRINLPGASGEAKNGAENLIVKAMRFFADFRSH